MITHSKTKAAGLEANEGKLFYEVGVLKDGKAYEVAIDPFSGKILTINPASEDEDENGERA